MANPSPLPIGRARAARPLAAAVTAPLRVVLAPLATVLAGVDAVIRRPSLLVVGAVALICLPSNISDVSTSGHITPADLAACAVVAVVAVRVLGGDRSWSPRGWLPFALALTAFAVATVTASDVAASAVGFVRYAELFVLVPVAVAMALRDRVDVLLVGGAVVTVTVVEGGVGVYQYVTKTGATYAGQFTRAIGTFGADQVLALGALIGYGLIVTLALGLALSGRARVLLLALAVFLLLPLGLTLSRGAWIATAASVLVLLALFSWRLTVLLAGAAVVVAAAVLIAAPGGGDPASGTVAQRITSITSSGDAPDQSVQDRYALWHAAIGIWRDHPVVGVGLKDFANYRDSYATVGLSAGSDVGQGGAAVTREPLLSAHNQYLMVLSEQGTVGILAFGTLLLSLSLGSLTRRPRVLPDAEERFLALAAPAIMVWTLIDFAYGDVGAGPTSVLLAIVLGIVARRSLVTPGPAGPAPTGRPGATYRSVNVHRPAGTVGPAAAPGSGEAS